MNKAHSFFQGTLVLLALVSALGAQAEPTSPMAQLRRWEQAAGQAGQAERGRQWFAQRHGGEWSCASCHQAVPTQAGRHASTGKRIEPLAPAAHPERLTDQAKTDKWFRRNCKDVLSRECSAQEKADVLAYLIALKP